MVAPGVNAQHHQHMFCARLDFAVDDPQGGKGLVVSEVRRGGGGGGGRRRCLQRAGKGRGEGERGVWEGLSALKSRQGHTGTAADWGGWKIGVMGGEG